MSIIWSEPLVERGQKDARRHRDKQRDLIKERLPKIIGEEAIITRKDGRMVRVPIRYLDNPYFRPKRGEDYGLGQGPGEKGDTVRKRPGSGQKPGGPGQEPGEDYLEVEIPIEEYIEMMFEDFGLPNLKEKPAKELEALLGIKLGGLTREAPRQFLEMRETAKIGLKRFWGIMRALQNITGRDELICFNALKQAQGIYADALRLIEDNKVALIEREVKPFAIFAPEDRRYIDYKEDINHQSQAVVILIMDVSGSMTEEKKYLARALGFFFVEALRLRYKSVEVRFIVHHEQAYLTDEESFFRIRESGGTLCYRAYDLAKNLIETSYPTDQWNVYVLHFSDGEDGNLDRAVQSLRELFETGINMFGYAEIQPISNAYVGVPELLKAFKKELPIFDEASGGMTIATSKIFPFLGLAIRKREDVAGLLREFFKKERSWIDG